MEASKEKFKIIMTCGDVVLGQGGQYMSYGFVFNEEGMEIFIPYSSIDRVVHYSEKNP